VVNGEAVAGGGPPAGGSPARSTGAGGSGGLAAPSLISAPRPYGEPPRAVSRATRRAVRCWDDIDGSETSGPEVTSGCDSALSGSPNSHSKLAGPRPRLSGVSAGTVAGVADLPAVPGVPAASRGGAGALATTRRVAGAGARSSADDAGAPSAPLATRGATARCVAGAGRAGSVVCPSGGNSE